MIGYDQPHTQAFGGTGEKRLGTRLGYDLTTGQERQSFLILTTDIDLVAVKVHVACKWYPYLCVACNCQLHDYCNYCMHWSIITCCGPIRQQIRYTWSYNNYAISFSTRTQWCTPAGVYTTNIRAQLVQYSLTTLTLTLVSDCMGSSLLYKRSKRMNTDLGLAAGNTGPRAMYFQLYLTLIESLPIQVYKWYCYHTQTHEVNKS